MGGRLVVVSNRIPTEAEPSGGLVVALHSALCAKGGIWIGSHPDLSEAPSAQLQPIGNEQRYTRLAFQITQREHEEFYLGFANSVLWPVCHRRGDLVDFKRSFQNAYMEVNKRLARLIVDVVEPDDLIWIQDYHFFPLASELRKLGFTGRIGFFLHIPFPTLGDLGALPESANLADWLADYDLVGLQTRADVARCLEMFRSQNQAEVMLDGRIKYGAQVFSVRSFPIGIDVTAFARAASQTPTGADLGPDMRGEYILGVDRLDYSKGLPNRFRAFAQYLEKRPDKDRRVSLLQIAPPTREEVMAYKQIRSELEELAGRLNGEHAELDWTPLRYIHRNINRNLLAKLYRGARVGMVTPLADGMNLVAKEYVAAQDPDDPGVLVLSHLAGAAEDLTEALLVNPYDIEGMSDALSQALDMPLEERKRRYTACMDQVEKTDVNVWCNSFISALEACEAPLGWGNSTMNHNPRKTLKPAT